MNSNIHMATSTVNRETGESRSQEAKRIINEIKAIEYELRMREIPEEDARMAGWEKASSQVKNFIIEMSGEIK